MSLVNQVIKYNDDSDQGRSVVREALQVIIQIMAPITPHICHDLWKKMGLGNIEDSDWIEVEESALEKTVVEIVVQVNGKVRGRLNASPDESEDELVSMAKNQQNIGKFLVEKEIRKVIHVPNKIINFVLT